jgi:hypothetical protein
MVDICFDDLAREMTEFCTVPQFFDEEVVSSYFITRRTMTRKSEGEEIIIAKGVSPESSEKVSYEEALKFAKIRAKDLERKVLDFTSHKPVVIE